MILEVACQVMLNLMHLALNKRLVLNLNILRNIFSSRFISNGILKTLIRTTYPPSKLPVLLVAIFIMIPAMIRLAPSTTPPPHIQAREPILSARF